MIKQMYTVLPGGPDPLAYAFLGPLAGAAARVLAGPISTLGGAIVTHWSGLGLLACAAGNLLYPSHLNG